MVRLKAIPMAPIQTNSKRACLMLHVLILSVVWLLACAPLALNSSYAARCWTMTWPNTPVAKATPICAASKLVNAARVAAPNCVCAVRCYASRACLSVPHACTWWTTRICTAILATVVWFVVTIVYKLWRAFVTFWPFSLPNYVNWPNWFAALLILRIAQFPAVWLLK